MPLQIGLDQLQRASKDHAELEARDVHVVGVAVLGEDGVQETLHLLIPLLAFSSAVSVDFPLLSLSGGVLQL